MSRKVLIVASDFDPTADRLVVLLRRRGAAFERFHPQDLPGSASLYVRIDPDGRDDTRLDSDIAAFTMRDVRSVWYWHTKPYALDPGLTDEERQFVRAETGATLFGAWRILSAFWMNHPDRIRSAETKARQLRLARSRGLRIPDTLFTNDPSELLAFYDRHGGRVVHKVAAAGILGYGERKMAYTGAVTPEQLANRELLRKCPGLFQEEIPKACDIRITVVGEQTYAAEINSQDDEHARLDWRRGDVAGMRHSIHRLPADVHAACAGIVADLGLTYGAIDMVLTPDGEYRFLEINPSGQFGWVEAMTGLPIADAIADLLVTARDAPGRPWEDDGNASAAGNSGGGRI